MLPLPKSGIGASLSGFLQSFPICPCVIASQAGWNSSSQATENDEIFLSKYLSSKFPGLHTAILRLTDGGRCRIDPAGFLNDINSISSYEDILTLLTYFGYLTYDRNTQTISIPNEAMRHKIRSVMEKLLSSDGF